MFWGLIMEPFKRYSQTVNQAFHVTHAALDVTTGDNEICQVMVGAQGKDFLICTLQKGKIVQTPLQLFFKEGSEISFTSSGKGIIHLTGFLEPDDFMGDEEEEEESESETEETPELVPITKKEKKRKADFSPDALNNKKQKNEQKKKELQKAKKADSSDSEDDSDDNLDKILSQDMESDENDESFVPNETNDASMVNESIEDEESEDDDDDDEDVDDEEEEEDSSEDETTQTLTKKQKPDKPQQNGTSEKKNKFNKQNENKLKQQEKTEGKVVNEQEKEGEKKEKKVLPGNVAIEDVKVGQGAVAKSGKMVQVYYEGRLKSNNKVFDSCLKGPGFKFRLGKKEVISGWDVGLTGMKVGGKRKIVCPPGMAYGKKGSPPVIPPNSTLVFDVELRSVN